MAEQNEIVVMETELVKNNNHFSEDDIRHRIYTIRGVQVMLDSDLARLYQVERKALNQAVKRNQERFPGRFVFRLTDKELRDFRSQFVTQNPLSKEEFKELNRSLRQPPYAFTEQGIAQLSAVLRSNVAVQMSIRIIDAFVAMRRYLATNAGLLQRLTSVEKAQLQQESRLDEVEERINARFDRILDQMEDGSLKHKLGIFFENQMFDAYVVVEEIVKRCRRRLVMIDDYVDGDVLERFRVREVGATVDVYVQNIHKTRAMETAFETYHRQYPSEHVELHVFNKSHDRWLIVDDEVYHFGASIKDLGKKWFQVSQITEYTADELIARLNN